MTPPPPAVRDPTGRRLAYEVLAAPEAPDGETRLAVFVHGILGSRKNWLGFGRRLLRERPGWRLLLVDLRGHGESHGLPGEDTVAACARDLAALCADLGEEPAAVVGHSFGGKVGMVYALELASELETLWVLDSTPGVSRAGGGPDQVRDVIEAVAQIPMPVADRRELVDRLRARGLSEAIALWMTTNLAQAEDGLRWVFDLKVIRHLLASYATLDTWAALESPPSGVDARLVRGGRSSRWTPEDLERLARIEAARPGAVQVLPEAGHWVHTDDPDGLLRALLLTF